MKFNTCFFLLSIAGLLAFSCQKYGNAEILFTHSADNQPVQYNQFLYTNTAGNKYQVNEIKYFISRLILIDTKGKSIEITQDNGIHYVDNSIDKSLRWNISEIPQKQYRAISFVFGLDENNNKSNRFVNPPESNFFWPEVLGGGYHYMQINGKFINKNSEIQNMNIHTGIGGRFRVNEMLYFCVGDWDRQVEVDADGTFRSLADDRKTNRDVPATYWVTLHPKTGGARITENATTQSTDNLGKLHDVRRFAREHFFNIGER